MGLNYSCSRSDHFLNPAIIYKSSFTLDLYHGKGGTKETALKALK
jgi:hypothetical protein